MMKNCLVRLTVLTVFALPMFAGCAAVIRAAPPPAKVEIVHAPPFAGALWIEGHWVHAHGEWVWKQGHWAKRPGPRAVWKPGHWKKRPWGWKWVPGHWKRQ